MAHRTLEQEPGLPLVVRTQQARHRTLALQRELLPLVQLLSLHL